MSLLHTMPSRERSLYARIP